MKIRKTMMTRASWYDEGIKVPHSQAVHEQDKPASVVVYDHTGQPYVKPRQPMGFDLSGKRK
jgi:hypothetical protein